MKRPGNRCGRRAADAGFITGSMHHTCGQACRARRSTRTGGQFDLDLAKVLLDVSVMPTMIMPIEDSIVSPTTEVAEYAAPEIPTVELVTESPGYAVPEDSGTQD